MSQDWKYQFHMGCGESLHSQWLRRVVLASTERNTETDKAKKLPVTKQNLRGGRKG